MKDFCRLAASPCFLWGLASLCLLALPVSAPAQGTSAATWIGGASGNYGDAANWICSVPNTQPGPCVPNGTQFDVIVVNGAVVNVNLAVSVDSLSGDTTSGLILNGSSIATTQAFTGIFQSVQMSSGAVINPDLGTNSLTMTNSTVNGSVVVGASSQGAATISGSTIDGNLSVGGSLQLSNSTIGGAVNFNIIAPSSISGTSVTGAVAIDLGGSLTLDSGTTFTSELSGLSQQVQVGQYGAGSLTVQGGAQLITGTADLIVGVTTGSSGSMTLDGTGSSVQANHESVGLEGSGQFTQSGGTNTVLASASVGESAGSNGSYTLSGGSLSTPLLEIGATGGTGTFDLQPAGSLDATQITVGMFGTLKLDGGSATYTTLTLQDGTLDVGLPYTNAGLLTGSGTINIGSILTNTGSALFTTPTFINGGTLLNNGLMEFSGNNAVNASLVNTGNLVFMGSNSVASLTNAGILTNVGTLTAGGVNSGIFNNNGTLVAPGPFVDSGGFIADPSKSEFQTLDVSSTGYLSGVAGDLFSISGNFQNLSTQSTTWNTSAAELEFTGGGTHIFDLAGQNGAGFTDNFAWGTLVIDAGNTLDLGVGSGDALYVDVLEGLVISGSTITNIEGAPGLFLYYNPADNPGLLGGDYSLAGGGELLPIGTSGGGTPVPEPPVWLLLAVAAAAGVRRTRQVFLSVV